MSKFGWTTAWALAAVGIATLGAGCSKQKPPPTAAELKPISEAEALEFGEKLADGLSELGEKAVGEAVDMDALMEVVRGGTSIPDRFWRDILAGARKNLDEHGNPLLRELRPMIEAGVDVRATKFIQWDGRPAVVIRMIPDGGGAGYIIASPEGKAWAEKHKASQPPQADDAEAAPKA